jgi:predicted metal-dependent peptidase
MRIGSAHPKIVTCLDEMMSDMVMKLYYYAEFSQFINFEESKQIERIGVTVTQDGMICYWNRKFIDRTPQKQLNFIIIHEIFHLLFNHPKRTRRGGFNHEFSNISQDMCINQAIYSDFILDDTSFKKEYRHAKDFIELPIEKDGKVWVLMMPEEYKGEHSFEDVYEWLMEEKDKYDKWMLNKKDVKNEDDCPVSPYIRSIFKKIEDDGGGGGDWLDDHLPSDISDEFKKDIIDQVQRYLNGRGLLKGNVAITLGKLQKSKKDHLNEIKTAISSLRGYFKEKSISKRNRRSINGIKGKIKIGFGLNVILDVSGSMGGYFQRALSFVFQSKIVVYLIQCDTEVRKQGNRDYLVIKSKKDFKQVEINGLGGTSLQPAIDFIVENKQLNSLNTLILTDGYTEYLDTSKLKKCLILSVGRECPIRKGNPRQIFIDSDIPSDKI